MLTPTTKDKLHDRPVSREEIVDLGLMTAKDYDFAAKMSLDLFAFGQKIAKENGLILVDAKYEIGRGEDGVIKFVDEIHTPDSSRFWISDSYKERIASGEEPENIDKEFLRLWFAKNCDPYNDGLPRQEGGHLQDIADLSHWRGLGNFVHVRQNRHTKCLLDLLQHLETLVESGSAERVNGGAIGLVKRGFEYIGQAQFTRGLHECFGHAHHQIAALNHIHSTDQTHRSMIA